MTNRQTSIEKLDKLLADFSMAAQSATPSSGALQKSRERVAGLLRSLTEPRLLDLTATFMSFCGEVTNSATKLPSIPASNIVTDLLKQQMVRAAEGLYLLALNHKRIPAWLEPVTGAVSLKCLNEAIKAKAITGKELEGRIGENAGMAYNSALGDWAVIKMPVAKISNLLELALTRASRPDYLPRWNQLIEKVLVRDKKFAILAELLTKRPDDHLRIGAIGEISLQDDILTLRMADAILAMMINRKTVGRLNAVIQMLTDECMGPRNHHASLCVARILAGVYLQKPKGFGEGETIKGYIKQLEGLSIPSSNETPYWKLERYPKQLEDVAGTSVTVEGANKVAMAIQQSRRGHDTTAIVTALAKNLGLEELEEPGQVTGYDPILHHDLAGGMIRGDKCVVTESGWTLNKNVVMRAKVRPEASNHET